MNNESNNVMKKFIQKMCNHVISLDEYKGIDKIEIFFVFGSKHKTAMCDWVYGMRVYSKLPLTLRDDMIRDLQMSIRRRVQSFFNQSICATDVIFEKS